MSILRLASYAACLAGAVATAIAADAGPHRGGFVEFRLFALAEAWRNLSGGLERGGWWNTQVDLTGRLKGPTVGLTERQQLVAQIDWTENQREDGAFSELTGAYHPVSGAMASSHVRVVNLHFRHDAEQERWSVKLGQIVYDEDFMASEHAALFANAAFGALAAPTATGLAHDSQYGTAFATAPLATLGIWAQRRASDQFRFQAGIYHGGPGAESRHNSGFRQAPLGPSGVLLAAEAALESSLRDNSAVTSVGVSWHTGTFNDLRAVERGEEDVHVRGLLGLYAMHDLVLLADEAGRPKLAGFFRLGASPHDARCAVSYSADAGLTWVGPFPTRPDDAFGIAVARTWFSPAFSRLNGLATAESVLELTYAARVAAWILLQADAQLLTSPRVSPSSGRRETSTVFGFRTILEF